MAGWVGDIRRGANPKNLTPKSPEGAIKNALGMYASRALDLPEGQANKPGCVNALVRKGAEEVPKCSTSCTCARGVHVTWVSLAIVCRI